jgi:hypothetical protein
MEPLVIFGAGLVVYCGYLSIVDEIRVLKKSYARRRVSNWKKSAKSARKAITPLTTNERHYKGNRRYAGNGGLLAQHLR